MKRLGPTLPAEFLRDVHQLVTDARLPSRSRERDRRHTVATINWSHFCELVPLNQLFQHKSYAELPYLRKLAGLRLVVFGKPPLSLQYDVKKPY